jgi:hypothetical protein
MNDQMNVERSRLRLLAGGAALVLGLGIPIRSHAGSASRPRITVYKSPT